MPRNWLGINWLAEPDIILVGVPFADVVILELFGDIEVFMESFGLRREEIGLPP